MQSYRRLIPVAVATLALLCRARCTAQSVTDQKSAETKAHDYLVAYTRQNVADIFKFWAPDSPYLAKTKNLLPDILADVTNIQIESLSPGPVSEEGGVAVVRVEARLSAKLKATGKPTGTQGRVVYLRKIAREWLIWRDISEETDFSERLFEQSNSVDRLKLLRAHPGLLTTDLIKALSRLCNEEIAGGKLDAAAVWNSIAFEAAGLVGDKVELAWCHVYKGDIEARQAKWTASLDSYRRAIPLFHEAKALPSEAGTYFRIGELYEDTSRFDEALKQYQAGMKIATDSGDREIISIGHNYLGTGAMAAGRYGDALEQFQISARMSREDNDKSGEVASRINIGSIYALTFRYPEALEQYEFCLPIVRASGDRSREDAILLNRANVFDFMGRYSDALTEYEARRQFASTNKDQVAEAIVRTNIGKIYNETGRNLEAIREFEAAAQTFDTLNMVSESIIAHNALGGQLEADGRLDDALKEYETGLVSARKIGNVHVEALCLGREGHLLARAQRYPEALQKYASSVQLSKAANDQKGLIESMTDIAAIYHRTGKHSEAQAVLNMILKTANSNGDTRVAVHCNWNLGDDFRELKQWESAISCYRKAVDGIEAMRSRTREESMKTGFFDRYTQPYSSLAAVLLVNGGPDGQQQAYAVSEQMKARTLVEILGTGKPDREHGLSENERKTEQTLDGEVTALTVQLSSIQARGASAKEISAITDRLESARRANDAYRLQLFAAHPDLQARRAEFAPASIERLYNSLFNGNPSLAIISYVVGSNETLVFVMTESAGTPGLRLSTYTVPVTKADLADKVELFRLRCSTADGRLRSDLIARSRLVNAKSVQGGSYLEGAKDLYHLLIAPAEHDIAGKSQLVILPDGILNTLPFQALVGPTNQHLIETFDISYAPSATALVSMVEASRKPAGAVSARDSMLAVGRPVFSPELRDLPATEQEAAAIGALFGAQPLLGPVATKANVLARISQARYIHFATHGLLNPDQPMYSAIALTADQQRDDGRLYARMLAELNLHADLVVLSACETGLGKQTAGEGMVGLSWSLFSAGAPSILVTQWSVADDSTRDLMVEFYTRMRQSTGKPLGKASSLRAAQLKLLHDGKHAHPFYWAPFVLIGNWK